jgi:adenylate cyclase
MTNSIDPKAVIGATSNNLARCAIKSYRIGVSPGSICMTEERLQRRLAAILSADVVGYSRLMGIDEAGTLTRLKATRRDVIDPLIAAHSGRTFKLMGDGALVEFASAVDAVTCAIEVQKQIRERNSGIPEDSQIQFRIGINVGDIIVEGDDIYGDGVNVAARIQALADPGGIYISRGAADQVRDKVPIKIETRGEQNVKNIARPIEVFCIIGEGGEAATAVVHKSETRVQTAAVGDKPTIAVLPFVNMSGEPEQEFFTDGMTEDILTELSRFRELFVISRNSAFVYKGKQVKVQRVAEELGVQYVVEGSVRKAGSRVRITVQLIDAETDAHLWAERYDRELADIFAIQDEVTSSIVSILPGRVAAAAHERVQRKPPENLAAYECVLAGKLLHHRSTRADNEEALRMLERAISLDPGYAHAHAWKACVLGQSFVYGWCANVEVTARTVIEELALALSLDENDSDVHRVLAAVNLSMHRNHDKALYHQERALALNPNDDLIVVQQGEVLTWIGQAEQGIDWIRKAMRLNPYHPERFWSHLGRAYFVARRYDQAIQAFQRISRADHAHLAFLAACHAQLGDAAETKGAAQQVLQRAPDVSIERFIATQHYKHDSDREHHRAALVKAQLPA